MGRSRNWENNNRDKVRAANKKWHANNPEKAAAAKAAWRDKNREKIKELGALRRFKKLGITKEKYEELLKQQDGKCAICDREYPETSWRIDHCHKSGKVRAILCHGCNVALGFLGEDIETMKRMIRYVVHFHKIFRQPSKE